MNAPSVVEGLRFVQYAWPELRLRVMAERYSTDGRAELSFFGLNGSDERLLHSCRVNLLSTNTMSGLAKRLQENSDSLPWTDILTYVTGKTLEIARRGDPVEEVWPSEQDSLQVDYLLKPLLYLNHPTVMFGDYGSLKSLLALVAAYVVQLPYRDNNLGLVTGADPALCLYLDYEDDMSSFRRRWTALERGFGDVTMPILYQRMTATVTDSVEALSRTIVNKGVGLLLVDSLGPAARGNLNDPEPAIKYHAALRELGVTSLTLAHTAKDQLTKKRTIFGSVFFTNLARSVWECKAEQETGEDEATISLKQTKANLSRLHAPLGYRFTFSDDAITVARADLRDTSLSGELPLSWQIKNLLRKGSFTVAEIAEQLESGPDTIGRTLRRMRTKGQALRLEDDTWGLQL